MEENKARLQLDMMKMAEKSAGDVASIGLQKELLQSRIDSQERIAGAKVSSDIASELMSATARGEDISFQEAKMSAELGVKISELMLAAERLASSERSESAKIASKVMEKVLDMKKDLNIEDVSVSVGGDVGPII